MPRPSQDKRHSVRESYLLSRILNSWRLRAMPTNVVSRTTLLLRKCNFQCHLWCDHEALQAVLRNTCLELVSVLDECDITAFDQSSFLETRILPEKHCQHHFIHLCWKILHEQHVRRLAFFVALLTSTIRSCRIWR